MPETAIQAQIDAYEKTLQDAMDRDYGVVRVEEAPEVRTPEEIQFDEALSPPETGDYELTFGRERMEGVAIDEARALQSEFNRAFAAMQLPTQVGQSLMDSIMTSMDEWQATPEDKRADRWAGMHMAIERNVPPGTTWKDIQDNVQRAFNRIPKGEFKAELMRGGALESVAVVTQLFRQGERLAEKARLVALRKK